MYRLYIIFAFYFLIAYQLESLNAQCTLTNNIGGIVYFDANGNGELDETSSGVSGISITAFDNNGNAISSDVSDTNGNYLLLVPNGTAARIEFTNLSTNQFPGINGDDNATSIQFITSPACDVHFAINGPNSLCDVAPPVLVPCYVPGDPLLGGDAANGDAIIAVDYNATGVTPNVEHLATAAQVGTVWGTAWDRTSQTLFASTFVKRYSGFGPMGIGGIYQIDGLTSGATVNNYFDIASCLNLGTLSRTDLLPNGFDDARDEDAYLNVGKAGLGGLSISKDGTMLWTVNLFSKSLIQIQIRDTPNGPLKTSLGCGDLAEFPIPSNCGSQMRPWSVQYHNGLVYLGTVCDQTLEANIYTYNPNTSTFSGSILNFSLVDGVDIDKGCTAFEVGCEWLAWTDSYPTSLQGYALEVIYPQPIISDLEFDRENNLIIGVMDRFAHQTGYNALFSPSSNSLYSGNSSGDVYFAYNDSGTLVIEQNGNVVDASGNIIRNGAGTDPSGGIEFFVNDNWEDIHKETFLGGLAINQFYDEALMVVFDPINAFSGGLSWGALATGLENDRAQLYAGGASFGKAGGLGDPTFACSNAIIEIGNYVWYDIDRNGVQDPEESPIPNITVELRSATGNLLSSTTTDAAGNYYFSSENIIELTPFTDYYILIPDYTGGVLDGTTLTLTPNDLGTDIQDSDGQIGNGSAPAAIQNKPNIFITTDDWGGNNHSYDFGFTGCSIQATYTIEDCTVNNNNLITDLSVLVNFNGFAIGEELQVMVDGQTQNYTVNSIAGSYVFLFQNVNESGNIVVENSTTNACVLTIPYSVPDYLTISNVVTNNCVFNPMTLLSTNTVDVEITWTDLNIGDDIIITAAGQSQSITANMTNGTQIVSFLADADGTSTNQIVVSSPQNNCAYDTDSYTAMNSCPECVLETTTVTVGSCEETSPGVYESELTVGFFWFEAPVGQDIEVNVQTSGGALTQSYTPLTSSGTAALTFTVPSSGAVNQNITLSWSGGASCNITNVTYDERPACITINDIALDKAVNGQTFTPGATVIFTIKVLNQGENNLTNVEVKDFLPNGLSYDMNTASQGSAIHVGGEVTWTVGTLVPGQSEEIQIQAIVAANAFGVFFNKAEVTLMDQIDVDSTPDNDLPNEDDWDEVCITVPVEICDLDTITVEATAGLFNYQWFVDTGSGATLIPNATNSSYQITSAGNYTYTADNGAPGGMMETSCCPIVVQDDLCVCEVTIMDVLFPNCILDNTIQTSTEMLVDINWKDGTIGQTLTLDIGGTPQSINIPSSSGSQTFTFNIPTDGSAGVITVDLDNGTCTQTANFIAPNECETCDLSISNLNNGSCNSPLNTHNLSFNVNWSDFTVGEDINVSAGGQSIMISPTTTTGSQIVNLTVMATGNSESIIVEATGFSSCSAISSYVSPTPCPPCALEIDFILPSACFLDNSNTSLQNISVGLTWTNAIENTIQVEIEGVFGTLNTGGMASGSGVVTIDNIPADSQIKTVNAEFTSDNACATSTSYTAEAPCPACSLIVSDATLAGDCYLDNTANEVFDTLEVTFSWTNAKPGTAIKFFSVASGTTAFDTTTHYFFIEPDFNLASGSTTIKFEIPVNNAAAQLFSSHLPDYENCVGNTIDFTAESCLTSIGSTVFFDANQNSFLDVGENTIEDVMLNLLYDANENGIIEGLELTNPVHSTNTDNLGNYLFDQLPPGNYIVEIPESQFNANEPLEEIALSSQDIATTSIDNNIDSDDNGVQTNGQGTLVQSPLINLMNNDEPINIASGINGMAGENTSGNMQDDSDDNNGNMTIDFGFVPNCPSITAVNAANTICEGETVPLISVNTTSTTDIEFVYFQNQQTGNAAYSGGTSIATMTPIAGIASISNVGNFTTSGTYYVYAIMSPASFDLTCRPVAEIIVTVDPLPNLNLEVSDPIICDGDDAPVVVFSSEIGVSYQLRLDTDNSLIGGIVTGTGSDITIPVTGLLPDVYTYNILATNGTTGCNGELVDKAIVTVNNCDFPDFPSPICISPACHVLPTNPLVYFGNGVTADPPGNGDTNANSDLDDGIQLPNNIRPNIEIHIPITFFNNTGNPAYIQSWIDWNGDSNFDANEQIANLTIPFNGSNLMQTISHPVIIPGDAIKFSQIAARFRISTDPMIIGAPCGVDVCAADGEVEDYLLLIECPPEVCLPVGITILRGN